MNLFPLFRSFLPMRNPIGFGVSDFLVLALAILLTLALVLRAWIAPHLDRFANRTYLCMFLLFALPIMLRLALLAQSPPPMPGGADDFGYVLLGDTLRHFRLANPPHALPQFFEAVFVLQRPAYASIFPLGQGIVLLLGWTGILLSSGAFCALCYWMLRAWVTPKWAFVGGLLAVVGFGPLNPWVNSYWGGLISACAGCLVFGSLPRLRRSPNVRYGSTLGIGIALQILTRPFETVFLVIAVALYFAFTFRSSLRLRPLVAGAAIIVASLLLVLMQNKAVTGSWTQMPYMLSRYQYGVPTTFTFQPNPAPHQPLTAEQELDYKAQAAIHGPGTDSASEYFNRLGDRLRYLRFFLLPPLYFAILAFIPGLRQKRYVWAMGTVLLFLLGTNFYPFFYPHYIAAVTCLFILFCVSGLARLNAALILPICGAFFAFWFFVYLTGNPDLLPLTDYQSWMYINRDDPQGRIAVADKLSHAPGQQLVFVHYSPAHRFEEWVHNAADIDAAQTVWANDLGSEENQKLLDYYPNRKAWLLEPDVHPPQLSPYEKDSGQFLTVH